MKITRLISTLAVVPTLWCAQANAQETVTLRVADFLPSSHQVYEDGLKPFMDAVTKASGDRIKFEYYPSEQLGKAKDLLNLVSSGVVDMALVAPSYTSEKLPLTSVSQLPGLYTNSCQGTNALAAAASPDGALGAELEKNNIRSVLPFMFQPPDIMSAKKAVINVADWQGMKIRVAGGPPEIALVSIGSVPVRMAATDLYQALSRGTIDAVLFPAASAKPYGLESVVSNVTTGFSLGSNASIYVINAAAWNKLPDDLKSILDTEGSEAAVALCERLDEIQRKELERLEASGVAVSRMDDAGRAELAEKTQDLPAEWASRIGISVEDIQKVLAELRAK